MSIIYLELSSFPISPCHFVSDKLVFVSLHHLSKCNYLQSRKRGLAGFMKRVCVMWLRSSLQSKLRLSAALLWNCRHTSHTLSVKWAINSRIIDPICTRIVHVSYSTGKKFLFCSRVKMLRSKNTLFLTVFCPTPYRQNFNQDNLFNRFPFLWRSSS